MSRRPLNVFLIANYRPDAQHSMLRYAELLRSALVEQGCRATLVAPPVVLLRFPWPQPLAKWIGYLDKYAIGIVWLRWKVRKADVVHICDHSNSMYLKSAGKKPRMITCHDLLAVLAARGRFPGIRIGRTGRLLQCWILRGLQTAPVVICVSKKTAADLRSLISPPPAQLVVIPNVLNRKCERMDAQSAARAIEKLGLPSGAEYLLHVGGNQWYKNRPGVLRIFAELRKRPEMASVILVMAGRPWTPEIFRLRQSLGLEEWVVPVVSPGDEDLRALYSAALALLFPSLEEGFGWPILEAQAFGCPVITTNRPPMIEVAGEAAIFIDPADPAQAARTIVEQWGRRAELREAGVLHAASFGRTEWVKAHLRVYEEALAQAPENPAGSAR